MYFLRLARLKPAAEEVATETWEGFSVRLILDIGIEKYGSWTDAG